MRALIGLKLRYEIAEGGHVALARTREYRLSLKEESVVCLAPTFEKRETRADGSIPVGDEDCGSTYSGV